MRGLSRQDGCKEKLMGQIPGEPRGSEGKKTPPHPPHQEPLRQSQFKHTRWKRIANKPCTEIFLRR